MNLTEAFQALDSLNEDTFSVDTEGIKKLQDFVTNDDSVDELSVFDLDAEDDEAAAKNCHDGDLILNCSVCHSDIYKPADDVVVDDETGLACTGMECPYCFSTDGYKIRPFKVVEVSEDDIEDIEVEVENKDIVEEDIDQVDISTNDVNIEIEDKEDKPEETVEDEVVVEESKQRGKWNSGKKTIAIKEATRSNPGLVTKKGSIANLLADHMHELQNIYDVNELKNKVIKLVDSSDIADTKGAKEFKYRVLSQRTAAGVLNTIGAYMSGISTRDKKESVNRKSRKLGKYVVESDNKDIEIETIDEVRRYDKEAAENMKDLGATVSVTIPSLARTWYFTTMDKAKNFVKSGKPFDFGKAFDLVESDNKEETIGDKLKKYQMWVDYDMKHYGKVSETTQDIIDKEGLQLIKDQYGDYEVSAGSYKTESVDEIEIKSDDMKIKIEPKDNEECEECSEETVKPLSDEEKEEIELNIDDVDKETMSEVGESFLKENYSNVRFFRAGKITQRRNGFLVEGIIGFKNGKKKLTQFAFKPQFIKNGKVRLLGENFDISSKRKSLSLTGKVRRGTLISESLRRHK